jgi:hypothetical protein
MAIPEKVPVDGCAMVGWALSNAMLSFMVGRKIMSSAEAASLLEGLLQTLEAHPAPTDPAIAEGRKLLETMILAWRPRAQI